MKPAFSTVACPDWTLPRVAERAKAWGYLGCELRTFGNGSTQFACDPALTAASKVRSMFDAAGVEIVGVATSVRFDEPITMQQRLIGDTEASVREAKGAIDLAVTLEAPLVRVFAFEEHAGVGHPTTVATIADRLFKAVDYARHSGVRIMLENGGSFETAAKLSELIDRVDEPGLCVCYNAGLAALAGERLANGVNVLGERLAMVRVQPMSHARPCALGEGESAGLRESVFGPLAAAGFGGWVVNEYNRAWFAGAAEPDAVLDRSAKTMYEWIAAQAPARGRAAAVRR